MNASASPDTPIPIGRCLVFDFFDPSVGYWLISMILLRLRVSILAVL